MKVGAAGCLFFSCVIIFSSRLLAQSAADDSLLYKKSISQAISVYHSEIGDQASLYNGVQYADFPFRFEEGGFQFFMDKRPGIGSVTYDDILFEKVLLQYDEIREVVIMQDSSRRIQLLNPRISSFTLFGNEFIHIIKDSTTKPLVRSGFYAILYKGNVSLLKKEEKLIREEVSRDAVLRFIDVNRYYYIKKDSVYYPVKNKNSILDIFADRKSDIRQFINKNKLSYRRNRDEMLAKTTAYYDQLNKSK